MATAGGHTVKAFDEDIGQLRAMISQMGGLAENAIQESLRCLAQGDIQGAAFVVEQDKKIDLLETEAERKIIQLIALRAPMADDLREAVAALRIASVMERIGDYAKNIAKRVPQLDGAGSIEPLSLLKEMGRIAAEMVHDVVDAYVERDSQKAADVWERDKALDDFYDSIFRALVTFMMEDPQEITHSAHLLFVAKNIERIGDHATNIAEMVYFAATASRLSERPKGHDATEV